MQFPTGFRPPDVAYFCELCHMPLTSKSAMWQHVRTCAKSGWQLEQVCNTSPIAETPDELFLCDEQGCQVVFASSSSELQLHKQKHKEKKMFLCGNCFSSFPSRAELAEHVKSHIPRKLPKADECHKNLPKSKLAEHFRTNHFNCTYMGCKQTFASTSELKAHVLVHCKYKSEHSGMPSKTFSHLEMHKRSAKSATSAGLTSPTDEHQYQWHPCHFPGCSFTFKLLSAFGKA
jgi:KRAB domain-containing zinc finger protein